MIPNNVNEMDEASVNGLTIEEEAGIKSPIMEETNEIIEEFLGVIAEEVIGEEIIAEEIIAEEPAVSDKLTIEMDASSIPHNLCVEDEKSFFNGSFTCPVCQSEFCIETGDPMTLECGHNICRDCLKKMTEFSDEPEVMECPVCRHTYDMEKDEVIPVAIAIKHIINDYKAKKTKIHNAIPVDQDKLNKNEANSIGFCNEHDLPIHFGCTVCYNFKLCGKCIVSNHSASETECKVFPINEALLRVREIVINELKIRKKYLKMRCPEMARLEKATRSFKNYYANCSKTVETDYLKVMKKKHKKDLKEINKVIQHIPQLKNINKLFESSPNPSYEELYGYLDSSKKIRMMNLLLKIKTYPMFHWDRYRNQDFHDFKDGVHFLRVSRQKGVPSRTLGLVLGKNRNESLLRYEFSDHYTLPEISYQCLSIWKEPRFAFLDIAKEEDFEVVLRVKIELFENNNIVEAFLNRMSQNNGSYLVSSVLTKPWTKFSTMYFGYNDNYIDYRYPEVRLNDKKNTSPIEKGVLGIYNQYNNETMMGESSMLFYINMEILAPRCQSLPFISYEYEPQLKNTFGRITEGLEELETLMKTCPESLVIQDCGVRFL